MRRLKIYIAALDQTIAAMREYGDSIDSGKASLRRLKIVERLTYKVIEMEKGLAAMAESYYPNAPWVMCRAPWQKQAEAFLAIDKATQTRPKSPDDSYPHDSRRERTKSPCGFFFGGVISLRRKDRWKRNTQSLCRWILTRRM